MSILLDALKKSEDRQRLGGIPDIHSSAPEPHTGDESGNSRWLWLLSGIVLMLLLYMTWRQYAPVDIGKAQPVAQLEPQPTAVESQRPAVEAARVDHEERVARTPVEQLPESAQSSAPLPQVKQPPTEDLSNEQSRNATSASTQPANNNAANKAADESAGASPGQSSKSSQQGESRNLPAPISYWELPENIRGELPGFRISVLVFATEPADRFVLLNGKRHVHGDFTMPGLQLVEIQPDRVVFTYRKYRFYLEQ